MYPFPSPSSIAQYYLRPAPPPSSSTIPTASPATALEANADPSLLSRIAGSALSSIKLSACCAIAASLAGLGTGSAALIAVGALTVGTTVCLVEAICARHDYQLPSAIVQHGVCNDWHTLIGGLAGGMPTTVGLIALASALAVTAADRPPQIGTNGLACLAVMVAVPAMLLAGRGMRAIASEAAGPAASLARLAVPMLAVSAALGLPVALLQQASPEAAVRFVVGFAANMASATVREALTQATLPAWRGIERTGSGFDYGLSGARGRERLGSTVFPTLISCLLFAGSSALTLHYLEAATDLGAAPAGQSILAQSRQEIARRSALRSLVLQSTNEMLEGLWRGVALAGYAGARGIALRYRNTEAVLADVPATIHASCSDPATRDRIAVFASARMLDGALPNLLAQLAGLSAGAQYWNGFPASLANPGTSQSDTTGSRSDAQADSASETPTSILVDSAGLTEESGASPPTPCAHPGLSWA